MIDGLTGDPGSCSQLGGALRSHAARLVAVREELADRARRVTRGTGATLGAPDLAEDLDAHLALLDTVARRLDAAGSVLQRLAQDLAEVAEGVRRLEAATRAAGLELDGLRVVEPWGVLTTELARERHRAQPDLQAWADRLATRLGRARTATARSLAEGTAALAAAATVARHRTLR